MGRGRSGESNCQATSVVEARDGTAGLVTVEAEPGVLGPGNILESK